MSGGNNRDTNANINDSMLEDSESFWCDPDVLSNIDQLVVQRQQSLEQKTKERIEPATNNNINFYDDDAFWENEDVVSSLENAIKNR